MMKKVPCSPNSDSLQPKSDGLQPTSDQRNLMSAFFKGCRSTYLMHGSALLRVRLLACFELVSRERALSLRRIHERDVLFHAHVLDDMVRGR